MLRMSVCSIPMPSTPRTAAEQRFWDQTFQTAYTDALRRDGQRTDESRITWAAARADGALVERQRSQQESQS